MEEKHEIETKNNGCRHFAARLLAIPAFAQDQVELKFTTGLCFQTYTPRQ